MLRPVAVLFVATLLSLCAAGDKRLQNNESLQNLRRSILLKEPIPTPPSAPELEVLVEAAPPKKTATPTEAPTESDAPHSPVEERPASPKVSTPAPSWEALVEEAPPKHTAAPTEAPTESDAPHSPVDERATPAPSRAPTLHPSPPPTEAPTESDAPHSPVEESHNTEGKVTAAASTPTPTPTPTAMPTRPKKKKHTDKPTSKPTIIDAKQIGEPDLDEAGDGDVDLDLGGDGAPKDSAGFEPEAEGDESQVEMAKNVLFLVGALFLVYLAVSWARRIMSRCCGSPDVDHGREPAQYTPVSSSGDAEDSRGIEMNPVRAVQPDYATGSQQHSSTRSVDDWGAMDDDDLDAELGESSPAPSTSDVHQERAMTPQHDGNDGWDDEFDSAESEHTGGFTSRSRSSSTNTSFSSASAAASAASPLPDEDNFLDAYMRGQEAAVPSGAKQTGSNASGGSSGTGRFSKKDPASPGVTSQAGVKVIKGLSLKDAFGKKK